MVLYYFMRVLASENNIIFMFFFYFFPFYGRSAERAGKGPGRFLPVKD